MKYQAKQKTVASPHLMKSSWASFFFCSFTVSCIYFCLSSAICDFKVIAYNSLGVQRPRGHLDFALLLCGVVVPEYVLSFVEVRCELEQPFGLNLD